MKYDIKNRLEAGERLAEKINLNEWENPLILALPRGGVPIAHVLSERLRLNWNVLLVKKIGSPNYPEFAIGALAENDPPLWNQWALDRLGYSPADLKNELKKAKEKITTQARKWRKGSPLPSLERRDIFLVDDGLATGMTMKVAIQFLRRKKVNRIGIIVPVTSSSAKAEVRSAVDAVIDLVTPEPFISVSLAYEDFTQVTDLIVSNLLERKKTNGFSSLKEDLPTESSTRTF